MIKVQKENKLQLDDVKKYLTIYLGEADWDNAIKRVYIQISKKYRNDASKKMQEVLSCAILLPLYDSIKIPHDPTKVLFWAQSESNLLQHDWYDCLQSEMEKDRAILKNRQVVSTLGVITPIDYSPITRQAFNWLYARGCEMGHIKDDNKKVVEQKYKNLVSIYGGQVICNLFERDSRNNPILKDVINWRSGYFIERLIFKTYPVESVIKIKKQELAKTNKDLIKQLIKN